MREARSCWAMSSNIWLSIKSRYCWRGHPRRSSRAWRIYGCGARERVQVPKPVKLLRMVPWPIYTELQSGTGECLRAGVSGPDIATLPTSLEVTLSRSLLSSTCHNSARIACSICSCSEALVVILQ